MQSKLIQYFDLERESLGLKPIRVFYDVRLSAWKSMSSRRIEAWQYKRYDLVREYLRKWDLGGVYVLQTTMY